MIKNLFVVLLSFNFFAAAQVHPLSEFDGTTPVKGILGENMAPTFWGTSFNFSHIYNWNYSAQFEFNSGNQQMVGYFVNNESYPNSIVVSALFFDGAPTVKNALITVPANSEVAVDLSSYSGYSPVGVYSLLDFELITSLPVTQNNQQVNQLSIHLPEPEFVEPIPGCYIPDYFKLATLSTGLIPDSERVVQVRTRYWSNPSQFLFWVDYPVVGFSPVGAWDQYATCGGEDYCKATSQSDRVYGVKGIVHFDETDKASFTCQGAPAPGDSCVPLGLNRAPRYDLKPLD